MIKTVVILYIIILIYHAYLKRTSQQYAVCSLWLPVLLLENICGGYQIQTLLFAWWSVIISFHFYASHGYSQYCCICQLFCYKLWFSLHTLCSLVGIIIPIVSWKGIRMWTSDLFEATLSPQAEVECKPHIWIFHHLMQWIFHYPLEYTILWQVLFAEISSPWLPPPTAGSNTCPTGNAMSMLEGCCSPSLPGSLL